MSIARILVVEDDPKIAALLKDYLVGADYKVTILNRGDTAAQEVRSNPYDLILLDIMLPGKDGLTVCREIRAFSGIPIIMLTAKVEEIDRLLGLELGADDYICKPFSPREVVARVRAVLRRTQDSPTPQGVLSAGPLRIDVAAHTATANGMALHLTPIEFDLLKTMMSQPGIVFSRSDLVAKVQGYEFDGYDRTIDSHVKNLRKKIAAHLADKTVIATVYGIGYKFSLQA